MNAQEILKKGTNRLREKKILSPVLDAEILLSKVLNKSREYILTNLNQKIFSKETADYMNLIERRLTNEPIAYILKKKEFWSKNFHVTYDTLIPRPETELIVDELVKKFKNKRNISILDIGTGSGCIIISLLNEIKNSKGVGIDISKKALKIAEKNARNHGVASRIKLLKKSITEYFNQKHDIIVSNPPYINRIDIKNLTDDIKRFEPRIALDGGNDGLDLVRKVIYKAKSILKINGILALEIGNRQHKKVSKLLIKNNFRIECVIKDFEYNVRCLIAKKL